MLHVLTNLESIIWSLSWSTLCLLMLYHNILRWIKKFVIWLYARGLSQSYLNSLDHNVLNIKPYLEFFCCRQTIKILKLLSLTHKLEHGLLEFYTKTSFSFLLLDHIDWSLQVDVLDANTSVYLCLYGIQSLNPTQGLQAIPMNNFFKENISP
jgi:hypothetical protein